VMDALIAAGVEQRHCAESLGLPGLVTRATPRRLTVLGLPLAAGL